MTRIELVDSGLVYRNPRPHVRSRQAAFPALAALPGGSVACAFALASAFEADDMHTVLARSVDGGRQWSAPELLHRSPADPPSSSNARIAALADGTLLANGARWDRQRVDEGLVNPETLGFVETELFLLRSTDGHHWSGPEPVAPPLVGPSFELCSPLVPLADGRLLWPTSTWRGWDGTAPHGMQAIALVSEDGGSSWPRWLPVMDGTARGVVFWELKIVPFRAGLLAVAWAHDLAAGRDLPVHLALSADGRAFGPPQATGLAGQTTTPLALDDERLLLVYRRTDRPGLWALLVTVTPDGVLRHEAELALWSGAVTGAAGAGTAREMSALRFGLPSLLRLADGDVLCTFWCVEECVAVVRWLRLQLQG